MKLLLDTHTWIWAENDQVKLGPKIARLLADEKNEILISTISTLEIAQLVFKKRLHFTISLSRWVEESIKNLLANETTLTHSIAQEAYNLPDDFHGDPVDRVLVATARVLGAKLVTADEKILEKKWVESINALA